MSAGLAGAVACAYAGGVIGLHRLNVYRLRKQAGFYPTLAWLDWQALLSDVFTVNRAGEPLSLPRTLEGGPSPEVLQKAPLEGCCAQHELLCSLTQGRSFDVESIEPAGFSGGEERWLRVLATVRSNPLDLIARFDRTPPASVAEVVLHEWLRLTHETTPFNLELAVFGSKRRLSAALHRFSEHAALFFVRAKASSLLGFNASVIDDLARAVYFGRQSSFYVAAVLESPFVEEARPALWRACHSADPARKELALIAKAE